MRSTVAAPERAPGTAGPPSWLPVAAVATTLTFWASAFVAIRYLAETSRPGR